MPQLQEIGSHKTTIHTDDNNVKHVVYHNTRVVSFDYDTITLRRNGYKTATTKRRMNQTSNQFNLGFKVYQDDFTWYVDYKGETLEFKEGMTLER